MLVGEGVTIPCPGVNGTVRHAKASQMPAGTAAQGEQAATVMKWRCKKSIHSLHLGPSFCTLRCVKFELWASASQRLHCRRPGLEHWPENLKLGCFCSACRCASCIAIGITTRCRSRSRQEMPGGTWLGKWKRTLQSQQKTVISLLVASESRLPRYLGYEGCSVKVQALSPLRRWCFLHLAAVSPKIHI